MYAETFSYRPEPDPVIQAATAMRVPNVEMVFMQAAEDAGFTNPQDVAAHRYNQWRDSGYNALPPYIKNFCLRKIFLGGKSPQTAA